MLAAMNAFKTVPKTRDANPGSFGESHCFTEDGHHTSRQVEAISLLEIRLSSV